MTKSSGFKKRVRALADQLSIPYAEARTRLLRSNAADRSSRLNSFDESARHLAESLGLADSDARAHLEAAVDVDLQGLVERMTLTPEAAELLRAAVVVRLNILVAGRIGSGKTTMLRALANAVEPHEKLITIEQHPELLLIHGQRHPYCSEMIESPPGRRPGPSMSTLVSQSANLSPSRLAVDQLVRPADVLALFEVGQAMDGVLATIHADSATRMLETIIVRALEPPNALPTEAILQMLANSIDLVAFLERDPDTGRPRLDSIFEVRGRDASNGDIVRLDAIFSSGATPDATYTGRLTRHEAKRHASGWSPPAATELLSPHAPHDIC